MMYSASSLAGARVLLDRLLRAIGSCQKGAAAEIVARDMDLVLGQRIDDVVHPRASILGIGRLRKLRDQLAEGLIRVARARWSRSARSCSARRP